MNLEFRREISAGDLNLGVLEGLQDMRSAAKEA